MRLDIFNAIANVNHTFAIRFTAVFMQRCVFSNCPAETAFNRPVQMFAAVVAKVRSPVVRSRHNSCSVCRGRVPELASKIVYQRFNVNARQGILVPGADVSNMIANFYVMRSAARGQCRCRALILGKRMTLAHSAGCSI